MATLDFFINFRSNAADVQRAMKQIKKSQEEMNTAFTEPLSKVNRPIQLLGKSKADEILLQKTISRQKNLVLKGLNEAMLAGDQLTRRQVAKIQQNMADLASVPGKIRELVPKSHLATAANRGKIEKSIGRIMGIDIDTMQADVDKLYNKFMNYQLYEATKMEKSKDALAQKQSAKEISRQEVVMQKSYNASRRFAEQMARKEESAQARYNLKVSGDMTSPFAPQLGMWGKFKQGVAGWWESGIGRIVKNMAGIAGLYVVFNKVSQAVRYLISQTIDLQLAFARINALSIASGKNYSKLKETVFALGTAHGFLATETVKAIHPLIQMGLSTEEINILTDKAMKVANLTGESLTETLNVIVSVMSTYNIKAQEGADLYAYWASLASRFAVTVPMIAKGFEQAGDTFRDFGFTAKEVSAVMAALMEGERGRLPGIIRFLRLMMENMADSANDIYRYMGVTVLDVTGAVRPGFQVLKEMAGAWNTMTDAQKTNLTQNMKNKSMLEALRATMGSWKEVQEAINLGLEKGNEELDKQSDLVENTVIKKWVSLKNVWIEISSGKAEGMVGLITRATDALVNMSKALADPNIMTFWKILLGLQDVEEPLETAIGNRVYGHGGRRPGRRNPNLTRPNIPLTIGPASSTGEPLTRAQIERMNLQVSNIIETGDITGYGNKSAKATTDEMRKQLELAQDLKTWAEEGYAKEKKIAEDRAKANENNLKIATLRNQMEKGYQVGINKDIQEEITKRSELNDTIVSAQAEINRLKLEEVTVNQALLSQNQNVVDLAKEHKEEIVKGISEQNVKLAEAQNALALQETIARKLGETYRNMILDTMVEIIEKTQTWLDLNYKLRDLLSNIGNNVLKNVLDKLTGGFVDAIGKMGYLATGGAVIGNKYAGTMSFGQPGTEKVLIGKEIDKAKMTASLISSALMGAAIGSNRGTKGMAGGAAGSMIGSLLGIPFGPAGAMIGSVAGGWLGSLLGKPKKDEAKAEEVTKSWVSIPSKIDITNSELQVVNRNLIALKEKFEPFPMPSSFYFSARGNAAVGAGQWGNVTINIDGSGDPQATANAVASIFSVNSLQGAQ